MPYNSGHRGAMAYAYAPSVTQNKVIISFSEYNLQETKNTRNTTAMKKWEYKIIDSIDAPGDVGRIFKRKDRNAIEAYLNELGESGWEIVNIDFRELEDRSSFCGVAKRENQE